MDLLCPVCAEPWDNDEFHEVEGLTYPEATAAFRKIGCKVFGEMHSNNQADEAIAMIYDMLGDDMDGAASFIEDFNL